MNKVFEALAHPTRRAILQMLKEGARSAGDIASAFEVAKPTMSGHFAKLREAGLIQSEQKGTTIFYSISVSTVEEVLMGFMGTLSISPKDEKGSGE